MSRLKRALYLIFAIFITFTGCKKASEEISLQEGTTAPDFTLFDLSGKSVNFRSELGSKKMYLIFWSSSCVNCKENMMALEDAYSKNRDKGFSVIAVNVYQEKEDVDKFVRELGLTYTVLLDKKGEVATIYDVFAIPVVYVVDSEGIILDKHLGDLTKQEVERFLDKYGL